MSLSKSMNNLVLIVGMILPWQRAIADIELCNDDLAICQMQCGKTYYFQRQDCSQGCHRTHSLCLRSPRSGSEHAPSPESEEARSAQGLESEYRVDLSRIMLEKSSPERTRLFSQIDYTNQPVLGYRTVQVTHIASNKTWKKTNWDGSFLGVNFELILSPDSRFFNGGDALEIRFSNDRDPEKTIGCSFNYPKFDHQIFYPLYSLEELGCKLAPVMDGD